MRSLFVALLFVVCPLSAQDPLPATLPAERRPLDPKATDRARQDREIAVMREQILKQSDAEAVRTGRYLDMDAARRRRAARLPELVKDIKQFETAFRQISRYSDPAAWVISQTKKNVRKQAEIIEDRARDILEFVVADATLPSPPEVLFEDNSSRNKVAFLESRYSTLFGQLSTYVHDQSQHSINVELVVQLIFELQVVNVVSQSLQK